MKLSVIVPVYNMASDDKLSCALIHLLIKPFLIMKLSL